jgi:hypothetical protein
MHPDCVAVRAQQQFAEVEQKREAKKTLRDYQNRIMELEHNNKTAYQEGCTQGMKMERKKLFDTLLLSRQLLLDTLQPIGINEHRVKQFVEWYEGQRDARVNPKQDDVTYKVCKNIMDLEDTLRQTMQEDVKLT